MIIIYAENTGREDKSERPATQVSVFCLLSGAGMQKEQIKEGKHEVQIITLHDRHTIS